MLKQLYSLNIFQPNHFSLFHVKLILCGLLSLILTACSSLGGGSLEKRATKLSNGIQTAYAVAPTTANRIAPLIIQSAEKQNLDPILVAAIIRQESTYRSQVTSPAGAVGLMQIIPKYWQNTCGSNLFDEALNLQCGTYILSKYENSAGSMKKALGYYNVGPTGYNTNRKMRKQGKRYAKQVINHRKDLKAAL